MKAETDPKAHKFYPYKFGGVSSSSTCKASDVALLREVFGAKIIDEFVSSYLSVLKGLETKNH